MLSVSIRRRAGTTAAVLLLSAWSAAASTLCGDLEHRLATGTGGDPVQHRQYVDAIGRQESELDKAVERDTRLACASGSRATGCRGLAAKIERMHENLAALKRRRDELASAVTAKERAGLLAALEENGCRGALAGGEQVPDEPFAAERQEEANRDVELNAGVTIIQPGSGSSLVTILRPGERPAQSNDRYRTVCVRTCDGYFFPMSVASTRMEFDRDQKKCEAACPGTTIALHYQPAGNYSSSDMMSWRTDEPYTKSATAYSYKSGDVPGCGCGASASGYSIIAGNPPGTGSVVARGTEPEPLAEAPPVTHLPPPEERRVRTVGPAFLPDRSEAIDLQAPGRPHVP